MTLNWQNIQTPFANGIDTKTHPNHLPIGKLTELENCVFDKLGSLSKRNGYKRFSNQILSKPNKLINAIGSATYSLTDLLIMDGENIYSYFQGYEAWVDRGECQIVNNEFRYIDSNFKKQTQPNLLVTNNLELFAWVDDDTNEVKYTIIDNQTKAKLVTDYPINSQNTDSNSPKCFNFGDYMCISYATSDGRLNLAVISPANPELPTVYTLVSDLSTDSIYDCIVNYSDNEYTLFVTYKNTNGRMFITCGFNLLFQKIQNIEIPLNEYEKRNILNLSIFLASGNYYVGYVNSLKIDQDDTIPSYIEYNTFSLGDISNLNNSYIYNLYNIDKLYYPNSTADVPSNYIYYITGIEDLDNKIHLYYNHPSYLDLNNNNQNINSFTQIIKHNFITNELSVGTPDILKIYSNLYSKPFIYNGNIYLIVTFETFKSPQNVPFVNKTDLQKTYFMINALNSTIKSKMHYGTAGSRKCKLLADVFPNQSGETVQINLINNQLDDLINNQGDNLVVNSFQLTNKQINTNYIKIATTKTNIVKNSEVCTDAIFYFNNVFKTTELNDSLYITGGLLQEYDGARVVDAGFQTFPENAWGTTQGTGNIAAGTYSYIFTYEWIDSNGKIEVSAPSPPVSVTTLAPYQIVWTIPNPTFSNKSNIRIGIYRTQKAASGDPLYYKVGLTSITNNYSVTKFTDNISDATLASNEILYCSPDTSGQLLQLENIAAPTCTIITSYKNRVFLAGTENKNQIWYSKSVQPGEPINFNEVLTINIDPNGGPITALGNLNNNLIVFKQNSIYAISGQGATNTGSNNDFSDPQLISSDCGCVNQNSLVLTSKGLFFQSSKGIYLLNITGQPEYIGAPVEIFNNYSITSASQVPDTNQIRFTFENNNTLVFDYFYNQWSTFTNIKAISGGVWNNLYYYVSPYGRVYQENPGNYLDHLSPINMSLTTGWISFAGLQNYQRTRSIMLLGDYYGHHILDVMIAQDNYDVFKQVTQLDTATFCAPNIYGEQNVYGDNSPYGGNFWHEQARVFIQYPRTQSIKIKIQEKNTEGNKGLNFVGLNFEVGQKKGMGKVAAKNQF